LAGKIQYNENEGEALSLSYQYNPPMENSFEIKDDKQKSLANLKNKVNEWQKQEEFVRNWNIESSNMYATPENSQKNILMKSLTRFSERKGKEYIQNKNKKATKDNADLTFQKNLNNPNKQYSLTYQTVVLKGRFKLNFNNPYLEIYSQYSFSKKDELCASFFDKNHRFLDIRDDNLDIRKKIYKDTKQLRNKFKQKFLTKNYE
jgi:hypothetical protein